MAAILRSSASRSLLRSLNASPNAGLKASRSPLGQQLRSQLRTVAQRPLHLAIAKPMLPKTLALVRWQSTSDRKPISSIDAKREERLMGKELKPTPETVSMTSTETPVFSTNTGEEDDTQMLAGIKADLQTIRDTFSLEDVPRQAYWMGMAGVLPYLATSLSTVFCAYEINTAAATGSGLLMSERTAELLLHVIEPIQVGYGAVIISFLGAIHWGLEWAGYGGQQGYPRYAIGVVSTALAWPTLLMPVEYALISQFLIFNFLYYTDSRATQRGWAPQWYGVYRFVLTFVVGGSIVLSLIGRGQIADRIGRLPSPSDRFKALQDHQIQHLQEEEEEARAKYLAESEEAEEDADDE